MSIIPDFISIFPRLRGISLIKHSLHLKVNSAVKLFSRELEVARRGYVGPSQSPDNEMFYDEMFFETLKMLAQSTLY